MLNNEIFEDWWVDPKQVDMNIANNYRCDNVNGNDIVNGKIKKILFINGKMKHLDVYNYGYRLFQSLKESKKYNYIYHELDQFDYFSTLEKYSNLYMIMYNYHKTTMNWLNTYNIKRKIQNIGIVHDLYPDNIFDKIVIPSHSDYKIPRPLYQNVDNLFKNYLPSTQFIKDFIYYKEDNIPIFGTFGFVTHNKAFQHIVSLINQQYDRAIIKIICYIGYEVDNIQSILDECNKKNMKPGIKLMITTKYFSQFDIVKFLSTNSMNILLSGFMYNAPDYALSVKVPLGISKYCGFNDIYSPYICVEETSIEECMKVSVEYCDKVRNKYSIENITNFFDELIDTN
jgi:hypothetical protein